MSLTDAELQDLAREHATTGPQPGELWKHYRGDRYVIVARSFREDDLTPLVTYRGVGNGLCWTRTLANFTEDVVLRSAEYREGQVVPYVETRPRFRRETV